MIKSNSTISDVALSLGFSDASYFSKVFKKITGNLLKNIRWRLNPKLH